WHITSPLILRRDVRELHDLDAGRADHLRPALRQTLEPLLVPHRAADGRSREQAHGRAEIGDQRLEELAGHERLAGEFFKPLVTDLGATVTRSVTSGLKNLPDMNAWLACDAPSPVMNR